MHDKKGGGRGHSALQKGESESDGRVHDRGGERGRVECTTKGDSERTECTM